MYVNRDLKYIVSLFNRDVQRRLRAFIDIDLYKYHVSWSIRHCRVN